MLFSFKDVVIKKGFLDTVHRPGYGVIFLALTSLNGKISIFRNTLKVSVLLKKLKTVFASYHSKL